MARGSTLFLDSMSVVMIIEADRHNIGSEDVSSDFSTIIVLIHMQLWILHVNNKRKLKSSRRGTCAHVLGFSHAISWFILPWEADLENMQGEKANGSLLCVLHSPIFLITAGALRFWLWFGAHSPMWLEWTSWTKTQFPGDCRVSGSGKTFFILYCTWLSLSLPLFPFGRQKAREGEKESFSNCNWLGFMGWESL